MQAFRTFIYLVAVWSALHAPISLASEYPMGLGPYTPPEVGELFRDFQALDQDGLSFQLSEQSGRVVVLHLCSIWCTACRESAMGEGAFISDLNDRVGEQNWVLIDALLEDNQGLASDQTDANNWRQVFGTPARTLHAEGDPESELFALRDQVVAYPLYVVIGTDGRIVAVTVGYSHGVTFELLAQNVINAWTASIFNNGFEGTSELSRAPR